MLTLLLLSLYKRWPGLAALSQLLITWWFIENARSFGNTFFLFTVGMTYIPFLICGQLLYLYQYKRISGNVFAALTLFALYLAMTGVETMHPRFLEPGNSYFVSFFYCYAIFVCCMVYSDKIKSNPFTRYFENISYSLYMYHGSIAGLALYLMPLDRWPAIVCFGLAIGAACLVSSLSYRFVELPAQSISRRLLKRLKPRKPLPDKEASGGELPLTGLAG